MIDFKFGRSNERHFALKRLKNSLMNLSRIIIPNADFASLYPMNMPDLVFSPYIPLQLTPIMFHRKRSSTLRFFKFGRDSMWKKIQINSIYGRMNW